MMTANETLKKVLPMPVKAGLKRLLSVLSWDKWQQQSWSQEGEDQVLRRIFEGKDSGLYIDVGAHHPKRFSNTYFFYRQGWWGINIDAMPGSMRLFKKWRPRDVNLEMGIGANAGDADYYVFNEPALNGFSEEMSKQRNREDSNYEITEVIKTEILPLRDVLPKYLPERAPIDFLTVDVEGLDLDVLQSNNWSHYRPAYVLVEVLGSSLDEIDRHPVGVFMQSVGYSVYAKAVNTVFFKNIH